MVSIICPVTPLLVAVIWFALFFNGNELLLCVCEERVTKVLTPALFHALQELDIALLTAEAKPLLLTIFVGYGENPPADMMA